MGFDHLLLSDLSRLGVGQLVPDSELDAPLVEDTWVGVLEVEVLTKEIFFPGDGWRYRLHF